MAMNFINKLRARGEDGTLAADLKRVTDSGVINIPKELFTAIHAAMQTEADRQVVMQHLQACLCEPSGKRWHRVRAGLVLADDLTKNGAPELLSEIADGRHFDLVQRVSFLEHFQYTADNRVQNMVRNKAKVLRSELMHRLEAAGDGKPMQSLGADVVKASGDVSPRASSDTSCSTTASTVSNNVNLTHVLGNPGAQMILNGIVAVGHCDDTTSESSSGEEQPAPKAVQYRKPRRGTRRGVRTTRLDSDQSLKHSHKIASVNSNPVSNVPPHALVQMHTQPVDLLDF